TSIHLADDSTIFASHSGSAAIPFKTDTPIPALKVPQLHKPLLLVAGVCNNGLEVLFTRSGCTFYHEGEVVMLETPIVMGQCKGDLCVLPS
ncbi:hypothetical protein CROQUDRAFT_21184, partial [Cronartium quercuum f. sp. fusiforme G11]